MKRANLVVLVALAAGCGAPPGVKVADDSPACLGADEISHGGDEHMRELDICVWYDAAWTSDRAPLTGVPIACENSTVTVLWLEAHPQLHPGVLYLYSITCS
jgi:hypothetical protein